MGISLRCPLFFNLKISSENIVNEYNVGAKYLTFVFFNLLNNNQMKLGIRQNETICFKNVSVKDAKNTLRQYRGALALVERAKRTLEKGKLLKVNSAIYVKF